MSDINEKLEKYREQFSIVSGDGRPVLFTDLNTAVQFMTTHKLLYPEFIAREYPLSYTILQNKTRPMLAIRIGTSEDVYTDEERKLIEEHRKNWQEMAEYNGAISFYRFIGQTDITAAASEVHSLVQEQREQARALEDQDAPSNLHLDYDD